MLSCETQLISTVPKTSIVCILILMSRINIMLSWVELEKSFMTPGSGPEVIIFFMPNSAEHEIYPADKC